MMARDRDTSGMILVLSFTLLTIVRGGVKQTCPAGDFMTNAGICCNKCPPGFKLKAACTADGHRSLCEECPLGQFSEHLNYNPNCNPCLICSSSKNVVEVNHCTSSKNTVCRCRDGYYKLPINPTKYECVKCKPCGENEEQTLECTPERKTECKCKCGFFRVKKKCESCDGFGDECPYRCKIDVVRSPTENKYLIKDICLAVLVVVSAAVSVVVTYLVTKCRLKNKSPPLKSPIDPLNSHTKKEFLSLKVPQELLNTAEVFSQMQEMEPLNKAEAVPLSAELGQSTFKLPDCVPLEIKTHEVIYLVLDQVPVPQVKRLVRLLGVSEIEIDQAEVDCRRCREAHYQMLKVWSQTGVVATRGGGQLLSRQLLQDLIRSLREIHLVVAAEALEEKYNIQ